MTGTVRGPFGPGHSPPDDQPAGASRPETRLWLVPVDRVLQRARKHKARLAADPEQAAVDLAWHYVTFDVDGWTIEHSLACRQTGRPDTCGFLAAIYKVAGEPDPDLFGRHRITEVDTEGLPWLERVDDPPEVP